MHPKTHGIQAFSDSPCSRWTNKTLVVSTIPFRIVGLGIVDF